MELTKGPWHWSREKIGDEWHCFLQGQPNSCNDTLVTAMRTDLAAFPYAVDTPNMKLIEACPGLLEQIDRNTNRLVNLLQVISDNLPAVAKWHEITEAKLCITQNRAIVKNLRGY